MLKVSLAIACAVSCRGWRRPDRTPKTICAQICAQTRADRAFCDRWLGCVCAPAVAGASGGRRVPSLRSRSLCCRPIFTISARVGASVPRPHATSPEPAALAHAARARCRRPGGPVPGPDGGLGHHRGGSGHPFEGPGGPGPVQGQKNQLQLRPGLAVIASHPGIVAPAAVVRKAPGLPPPGRCRPAGPGRQYSGPALAAGGRHGLPRAGGAKGKPTEAQAAELEEALAREGFLAKPRPDRTPLQQLPQLKIVR